MNKKSEPQPDSVARNLLLPEQQCSSIGVDGRKKSHLEPILNITESAYFRASMWIEAAGTGAAGLPHFCLHLIPMSFGPER